MTTKDVKRKLTAILSADVQGYSRLMGDDERATVDTITAYRTVMTDLIQTHHGKVVDAKGDNVLAEFPSVVDAIQCAVEIQKKLGVRNADLPEHRRMAFRMGLTLGMLSRRKIPFTGMASILRPGWRVLPRAGGFVSPELPLIKLEKSSLLAMNILVNRRSRISKTDTGV